ncbi:MAG: energy-coupling factor transporter ATPase [Eubacteriales bacterium]|nr:energy-coupling factor transporter ATPase [Eubacteriales bacterium]
MSIRCEKLTHIYQQGTAMQSYALRDISFEIEDGEFIGLIGHTGSGKSTLIQHLNGLMRPSSGTVYFNGEDIFAEGYDLRALRGRVGLVFQYPEYQLFEADVLSDVKYGPKNMGLTDAEAEERAKEALKLSGLSEEFYERSPFELSGGQKRRAAIAGVLAMRPQVLILDEPTAGLDPKGRDEILETVSELHKKQHTTILLVSHSMEDIAQYADRLLVLNEGNLCYFDRPKRVFQYYRELERMGLSAPQITYLMHELKDEGADVDTSIGTVAEAKDAILALYEKKQAGRKKQVN